MAAQPAGINEAAGAGNIERLYVLIAGDPTILGQYDELPFCETPLHIAAETGQTHFAMELMTLKPSLALKLNLSGFSPMHLALTNNFFQTARGLLAIDSSLVSIKGRGRTTSLHYVAQIGQTDLLSEFLFACPSSVEDLTIKCETAVHIAVKNSQFLAFKVLLGWVQRAHREEILDWKDEDGNTVFHIAALTNQTEVMKLLRRTVKVKARNLAGKTAMDILQTHQSPRFPIVSRLLQNAKDKLLFGPTMNLVGYLREKPSLIEKQNKLLGLNHLFQTSHRSLNSNDGRSAILVVAILIVTATYQAGLSPPGGYWQENSSDSTQDNDNTIHAAGQMTMSFNNALFFYILNGIAFFSSLYVIMILIIGLPMWMVLYGSTAALGIANYASFIDTFPNPKSSFGEIAVSLLPFAYPVITGFILSPPVVAFFMNKRRRNRVDFPARYFTSSQELS
ncbi:PREDICTED: ankyrin repeat-containing protein NPR4-like [Camelina sativa]|uniref:Ankyrin repeat-containing protein NPR4-like n=1 Tax=Camelina sativa TaxID=90675 RepID=A0ABM0UEP8_CAMSA|nr:PREDICTED: ankyrin repeat-containing protein NPR4-like [Camelina sativa]